MTAKIRSYRPDLFESDGYVRLGRDARRVLLELIGLADDEGRVQGSARYLRSQRYACDDDVTTAEIEGWITEVEREGWIVRYQVAGNTIAQVNGWRDFGSPTYQVLDRPKPSRLPPPAQGSTPAGPPAPVVDPPSTPRRPVADSPPTDRRSIDDPPPTPRRPADDPPSTPRRTIDESSTTHRRSVAEGSTTDLDLDQDRDLLSPRAPDTEANPDVCGEREWLALWDELAVGRGRVRQPMHLTGIERANIRRIGKPAAWWREVLEHVERSAFLRGEEKGFVITPKWLLGDEFGTNATATHAGQYDDAPPAGTVRTGTTAQALTEEQLARLTAFRAGWTRGASTDGHVLPAEPPGPRTSEADRVLVPQLDRWAAQPATAAWTTGIGAEGAAAYLRSQVVGGKRRGVPDLAKLARTPVELEEALRNGERYRKAPPPASAPAVATASTHGPAPAKRADETPAATLARLRAKADAGMASVEDRSRIAELERRVGEHRGETTMVLDDMTAPRAERRTT